MIVLMCVSCVTKLIELCESSVFWSGCDVSYNFYYILCTSLSYDFTFYQSFYIHLALYHRFLSRLVQLISLLKSRYEVS